MRCLKFVIKAMHFLQISCHGQLNQELLTKMMDQSVLDTLIEMEQEGILYLHDGGLKVTTAGEPFIRIICRVFNKRMNGKTLCLVKQFDHLTHKLTKILLTIDKSQALGFVSLIHFIKNKMNWNIRALTTGLMVLSGILLIARVFLIHIPNGHAHELDLVDIIICR